MTIGQLILDIFAFFGELIFPFFVVDSYEECIVLRLGGGKKRSPGGRPYHKHVTAGFHWKIPFIDALIVDNVVPTTAAFPEHVFETADGYAMIGRAMALWSIKDIITFMLDVEDGNDVLVDSCSGTVRQVIQGLTLGEARGEKLEQLLTTECNKRARRWGVKIHQIYIPQFAETGLKRGIINISGT